MSRANETNNFDVIIVGSGIAGLLLAVELDQFGLKTALVCKGRLMESNTAWAQGGVSICTNENPLDNTEKHLADTLSCGAGLSNEKIARNIIEGGHQLYLRLEELGLNFDKTLGKLELAREGGHSQSRVLHVADATGRAISETLVNAVRKCRRVHIFEHLFAYDLIMANDRCSGLRCLRDGKKVELHSAQVVLASGGLGQVFDRTTNPAIATGDGIAMAYRAGARLVDMEFVQFHPTALYLPGAPASLLTEAIRGAGGQLLDSRGERFAFRFHPAGELATRDVVSRAIQSVMLEQNIPNVHLDLRPIGAARILEKFPNIVNACRSWGLDPLEQAIPVSPAAHYFMGGILTDEFGASSIAGLYAIGECASSGFHGANRLASNSLLEGGVMALRIAMQIVSNAQVRRLKKQVPDNETVLLTSDRFCSQNIDLFKKSMFNVAGLCRDGDKLAELAMELASDSSHVLPLDEREIEAANVGLLGSLIAKAALNRCESRGAHFRVDYPYSDDARFMHRYFMSIDGNGYIDQPSVPASSPISADPLAASSAA